MHTRTAVFLSFTGRARSPAPYTDRKRIEPDKEILLTQQIYRCAGRKLRADLGHAGRGFF